MPISDDSLEIFPISFTKPGSVAILDGPCSARGYRGSKIPLDGHHYEAGGRIFLRNGSHLTASLSIQTHSHEFLESAWCHIGDSWYETSEPEFLSVLGLTESEAFPYTWLPDVPLDCNDPGPYPMRMQVKPGSHMRPCVTATPLHDSEIGEIYGPLNKHGYCAVLAGPGDAQPHEGGEIPLDGRHYRCGGQVTLRNMQRLHACLSLTTRDFEFLEGAWCRVGDGTRPQSRGFSVRLS